MTNAIENSPESTRVASPQSLLALGGPCGIPWLHLIICYCVLLALCLQFPYSGDDWTWGSYVGLDRLASGFVDYNGRYAGDLVVIALTRSYLIRSVVMALFLMAVPLLIIRIARGSIFLFVLSVFLLAAMPVSVRAQGVVWTSGFANYATSSIAILLYLRLFLKRLEGDRSSRARDYLPACLLGFIGCLFVENVTLFFVGVSFVLLLFARVKFGWWDKLQIAFLVSAILGAATMFTNSNYGIVLSGGDELRVVDQGNSAVSVLEKLSAGLAGYIVLNNGVLNIVLAFAVIWYFSKAERSGSSWVLRCIRAVLLVYVTIFSLYSLYVSCFRHAYDPKSIGTPAVFASLAFLLAWFALAAISAWRKREWVPLFIVVSIIALAAPFIIIEPVGPRNFLSSYILWMLLAVWYLSAARDAHAAAPSAIHASHARGEKIASIARVWMPAVMAVAFLPWFVTYGIVAMTEASRLAAVQEGLHEEAAEIVIDRLPFSGEFDSEKSPVWHGNPDEEWWNTVYKFYYGIPEDVTLLVSSEN